jgi:signal peptidase I/APA family basic amino acid/polyamine antiporter
VRRTIGLLGLALAAAAVVALLRRLVTYEIGDHSMSPTLQPGDRVLGLRGLPARRGDVVVFAHPLRPGFEMVKRVAAVSGEDMGRVALGPGEMWVLGDNPEGGSIDSRALGPIRAEWLRSRLLLRYQPAPVTPIR